MWDLQSQLFLWQSSKCVYRVIVFFAEQQICKGYQLDSKDDLEPK